MWLKHQAALSWTRGVFHQQQYSMPQYLPISFAIRPTVSKHVQVKLCLPQQQKRKNWKYHKCMLEFSINENGLKVFSAVTITRLSLDWLHIFSRLFFYISMMFSHHISSKALQTLKPRPSTSMKFGTVKNVVQWNISRNFNLISWNCSFVAHRKPIVHNL